VQGLEYVRESLDLTVWGAAQDLLRRWEASGQVGVVKNEIPTIREAVQKHIADAEARNLKAESVKKVKDKIERRFLAYCLAEGYRSLRQLDVDAVREFRNRLVKDCSANSARKRLEYARSFFRFCHQSGWMTANPAAVIKPPNASAWAVVGRRVQRSIVSRSSVVSTIGGTGRPSRIGVSPL
jgi:Phage integrase SAM-like domain